MLIHKKGFHMPESAESCRTMHFHRFPNFFREISEKGLTTSPFEGIMLVISTKGADDMLGMRVNHSYYYRSGRLLMV